MPKNTLYFRSCAPFDSVSSVVVILIGFQMVRRKVDRPSTAQVGVILSSFYTSAGPF